jgi:hypothetical protein
MAILQITAALVLFYGTLRVHREPVHQSARS